MGTCEPAFHTGVGGGGRRVVQVLDMLCGSAEYNELPVRHNEDRVNAQLAAHVRWSPDLKTMDDPHTKANLLLQVRPPVHKAPTAPTSVLSRVVVISGAPLMWLSHRQCSSDGLRANPT